MVPDEKAEDESRRVALAREAEIERRIAEIDSGAVELVPAEQVFAELRARLRSLPAPSRMRLPPADAAHRAIVGC
jgi:hypothetical protein